MKQLWKLFLTFAKIGLFTFGGGYAMIAIIENECVEKKEWITHDDMMNITVIAESTPGPIAINCATFVGYRQKGFWGAVFATIGVILPSFVIIAAIALFLDRFLEITWVANAFKGIKLAVGILILDAGIKMFKKMKKEVIPRILTAVAFLVMILVNVFSLNFSSIAIMLIGGIASLCIYLISKKAGVKNDQSLSSIETEEKDGEQGSVPEDPGKEGESK